MNVFKKTENKASSLPAVERLQYGVKEAAQKLSMSERKLYDLISKKEIPSYKTGGRRFISSEALSEFVATQAKGGSDGKAA